MGAEHHGKYPEFAELKVTKRPSEYLSFAAGLDFAHIVEVMDSVTRLQLDFIATHDDPVKITLRQGSAGDRTRGVWQMLISEPVYFEEWSTHLWLLANERGGSGQYSHYAFRQSSIIEIHQPDETRSEFEIVIDEESPVPTPTAQKRLPQ